MGVSPKLHKSVNVCIKCIYLVKAYKHRNIETKGIAIYIHAYNNAIHKYIFINNPPPSPSPNQSPFPRPKHGLSGLLMCELAYVTYVGTCRACARPSSYTCAWARHPRTSSGRSGPGAGSRLCGPPPRDLNGVHREIRASLKENN